MKRSKNSKNSKNSRNSRNSRNSNKSSCPSGMVYRRPYTRYRGKTRINVAGNCIRETSETGLKRSVLDKEYIASRKNMYKEAKEKFNGEYPKECPPGTILREGFYRRPYHRRGYSRKNGTHINQANVHGAWVPPTCAPSINAPHKKKRLFVLERGTLGAFGYDHVKDLTTKQRHHALDRAIKVINPLSLLRKVNALYVLNKNRNPELAELFHQDVNYIRHTQAYQNRPTARSKHH